MTLEENRQDLLLSAGVSMLTKNRPTSINGVCHGGIAVLFKEEDCNFKEIKIPNPDSFEVLVAAESMRGHSRKVVVVACYIPPNYSVTRGKARLDYITGVVINIKRTYLIIFDHIRRF